MTHYLSHISPVSTDKIQTLRGFLNVCKKLLYNYHNLQSVWDDDAFSSTLTEKMVSTAIDMTDSMKFVEGIIAELDKKTKRIYSIKKLRKKSLT